MNNNNVINDPNGGWSPSHRPVDINGEPSLEATLRVCAALCYFIFGLRGLSLEIRRRADHDAPYKLKALFWRESALIYPPVQRIYDKFESKKNPTNPVAGGDWNTPMRCFDELWIAIMTYIISRDGQDKIDFRYLILFHADEKKRK